MRIAISGTEHGSRVRRSVTASSLGTLIRVNHPKGAPQPRKGGRRLGETQALRLRLSRRRWVVSGNQQLFTHTCRRLFLAAIVRIELVRIDHVIHGGVLLGNI